MDDLHVFGAFDWKKKRIRPGQPDLFFQQGNSVLYAIISYDFMNHLQNMKLGVTL